MPTAQPATDEALAQAAAQGSRTAFADLVERYAGRVVAVLVRRVGDHHAALDLAQEAWLRAFAALPRFTQGGSFRSWLFAIVLNAARDEHRRRQRNRLVPLEDVGAAPPDPDVVERAAIDQALDAVAEPFRSALVLVDVEGLDYAEAAGALGCAVGTAKSRVHRGRLAFRDHWTRLTAAPIARHIENTTQRGQP